MRQLSLFLFLLFVIPVIAQRAPGLPMKIKAGSGGPLRIVAFR